MIRRLSLILASLLYSQFVMALHGEILPLFWYVTYKGDVQVSFKKISFNSTKPGALLYAQLQQDRLGVFTNLIYAYTNENKTYSGFDTHLVNKFGAFTGAAYYNLFQNDGNIFAPYLGVRFTFKNSDLEAHNQFLSIAGSHNKHWADPIIGFRDTYYFNRELFLFFSGDVGGLSTKDQYSYNLLGLVGYKLNGSLSCLTLYAGYEWLYERYRTGHEDEYFNWSMSFHGPLAGISFSF